MIRTALALTVALLSTAAVSAADLLIPTTPEPIYEAGGFGWEGLYAGVRGGGQWFTAATYGVVGGVVGFNYLATDSILLGAEVTGDYTWTDVANSGGGEFFLNARGGVVVTDAALIYALGGMGFFTRDNNYIGLYQLGGGVEFAVTDAVTLRGELVGQGSFTTNIGRFFDSAKATVGVSYNF